MFEYNMPNPTKETEKKTGDSLADFDEYRAEVAESVSAVQRRVAEERDSWKHVELASYPSERLKEEIVGVVREATGVEDVQADLASPPPHIPGDFALEVFYLSKKLKERPNVIAERIAGAVNAKEGGLIDEASVTGGFVNLETNKDRLYQEILLKILELGVRYGESDVNAGKTTVIDYSAPNIAKPIGVGHLRSTIIGQALSNIYHETGSSVIRDNHLGDWGTQFGKLIYAYKEWGDEARIEQDPIRELKDLYVKFHEFSKEHPEVEDAGRDFFARLEKKDSEMVDLWKRFRDLSLKDFSKVYDQLGVSFDTNIGESYFADQADELVKECMEKGLCRKDEASEAVVVDQMGDLPSFLLRKQDGSSLYLSRDLATLQFREEAFKPDSILYVVGSEQDVNFKQLFELAKRSGRLPEGLEVKHVGFGMVLVGGKKMSTRRGTLIELEDLLSQSIEKSREILLHKNPNIDRAELDKISEIVGIGAIIYNDLRQSRIKNISFDWDRMLDLEGGSAVYLQYSYVRINSILRKLSETYGEIDLAPLKEGGVAFASKSEFDLAKKLMMFPEIIIKAQQSDSPHHVCGYLEELALLFNSFYNETSILKTEDKKLRDSRILLSKSVAMVIKKGLGLLNIRVPEKM